MAAAPTSNNDQYAFAAGGRFSETANGGLLANDFSLAGAAITVASSTQPMHGTVAVAADGSFVYTPNPGFVGIDSFTYITTDGSTANAPATVQLLASQAPPIASPDAYLVLSAQGLTRPAATGLLANDTDPSGLPLAVTSFTQPLHGTVMVNADGSFTYQQNAGYAGTDSFTYTAGDGVQSASQTVTFAIPSNGPSGTPDTYIVELGSTLTVRASAGLLANDTDPYGLPLTVVSNADPGYGNTLAVQPDGSFTFVANTHPSSGGFDYFSYTVSDGLATSTVQSRILVDVPPNTAFVANADSFAARPGQLITGNLMSNDTTDGATPFVYDINGINNTIVHNNGGTYTYTFVQAPITAPLANGSVTVQPDGRFIYTPNPGFVGTDTATYDLTINGGFYFGAAISFSVVNTPPVARLDSYAVQGGHGLSVTAARGLLANDTDVNGDAITVSASTQPANGGVTVNQDGSFSYTPNAGFAGFDSFTYTTTDGYQSGMPTSVTLAVSAAAPNAGPDAYGKTSQQLAVMAAKGLLANDTDPGGFALSITDHTQPSHGFLSLNADGSFSYTSNSGFRGTDSFTYTVSNGFLSSPGTVQITTACFAAGTKLATARGGVAIECLREGDLLRTGRDGTLAQVRWLGHRRVDCRRHPRPGDVWPVLVRAHSFGRDCPQRDVRLSPDHCVFVDGVLIPIRHLVNGVTILQSTVDSVTYWHVELPHHDIVSAEGLPCESYLDSGNRSAFANAAPIVAAHPSFAARPERAGPCAPMVVGGPALARVRTMLASRIATPRNIVEWASARHRNDSKAVS